MPNEFAPSFTARDVFLELPAELRGETPRAIPPEMWNAPAIAKTRRGAVITIVVGFGLLLMSMLPITATWGLYFLPLAYLPYISLVVIVIGFFVFARYWLTGGNLRYVRHGKAQMGEVAAIDFQASNLNGVTTFVPQIAVEFSDGTSGLAARENWRRKAFALPGLSVEKLAASKLRIGIGDRIPVVWFDNDLEKSACLYDALGLHEQGLWENDAQATPKPLWLTLMLVSVGGLLFFSLIWSIWAMSCYSPLQMPSPPVWIGCLIAGIVIACLMTWLILLEQRVDDTRKQAAALRMLEQAGGTQPTSIPVTAPPAGNSFSFWRIFSSLHGLLIGLAILFGSVMLPSIIIYELLATANALLDRSPGKPEIAAIDEFVQVTHNGIFREYKIKYHLPNHADADKHLSLLTTPDHIAKFHIDQGVAIVKEGALGWPWVSEILPVQIDDRAIEAPQ